MIRVYKRPFLLLEVLIAFFLVTLCALPLMQPQFAMLKTEHTFIRGITLDRIVNRLYADFLIKLYNQEISWTQVGRPNNPVSSVPIVDEELRQLGYSGTYTFGMVPGTRGREKNQAKIPQKYLLQTQYTFESLKNTLKEEPIVYTFKANVKTPTTDTSDAQPQKT